MAFHFLGFFFRIQCALFIILFKLLLVSMLLFFMVSFYKISGSAMTKDPYSDLVSIHLVYVYVPDRFVCVYKVYASEYTSKSPGRVFTSQSKLSLRKDPSLAPPPTRGGSFS